MSLLLEAPEDLQEQMKVERWLFELVYSHGEGSGAEDLLVLHLVVGHEQGDGRL